MSNTPSAPVAVGLPPAGLRDYLVNDVLDFVYEQLPAWRDDPQREDVTAEKRLNEQLCTYLIAKSHDLEKPYTFYPDEFQAGERQVDLAAKPLTALIASGMCDSIYKPIAVLEAKRLPAPTKARSREYLTGDKASGGVQRFKLKLHGADYDLAGMVGYIQKDTHQLHSTKINEWICDLAEQEEDLWGVSECLTFSEEDPDTGCSCYDSRHRRIDESIIHLRHLWADMNYRRTD